MAFDRKLLVLGAAGVAVAAAALFLLGRTSRATEKKTRKDGEKYAKGKTRSGVVTQLFVHPVKSLAGTSVSSFKIRKDGVVYDREWGVFTSATLSPIVQKNFPVIKQIVASVDEKRGVLVLRALASTTKSGREATFEVPLAIDEEAPIVEVVVGSISCKVRKSNPEVGKWLSDIIGEDVFLARSVTDRWSKDHKVDGAAARDEDHVKLQSFSTIHLVTEEGLQWVRDTSGDEFNAPAVRPNIVVSGFPFPEEDSWEKVRIGPIACRFSRWCTRCPFLNIHDDSTVDPEGRNLATLKKHRLTHNVYLTEKSAANAKAMFGINLFNDDEGTIKVGDTVVVTEWHAPADFIETKA